MFLEGPEADGWEGGGRGDEESCIRMTGVLVIILALVLQRTFWRRPQLFSNQFPFTTKNSSGMRA